MKKNKAQGPAQKKMSKKTQTHFIDLLKDGDNFEKEKSIDALIASPGKDVVEGIIPLLQQKNTSTRMADSAPRATTGWPLRAITSRTKCPRRFGSAVRS